MDELLRYFEEELGVFGQYAREFRQRFPQPAGQLHIAGEHYDDPGVARLIQSVALLSARIHKRLDDDYPKFTESLLESLYPHYLRPLPSYAIAQWVAPHGSGGAAQWSEVARDTPLRSAPVAGTVCQFRTVYPVRVGPLQITRAAFQPALSAPASVQVRRGVRAGIAIDFRGDVQALRQQQAASVRVFVDGDPALRAALIDALFLHARAAWVQINEGGPWLALPSVPLRLAGLADDEAMLPMPARSHPAFRLLSEYFTYPEKFHFIDIGLEAMASLLPSGCTAWTLQIGLAAAVFDDDGARALAPLAASHFLLGCTPVVNLFQKAGEPIQLSHTSSEVGLLADAAHAAAYEIHSIDRLRVVREARGAAEITEFTPLYALRHGADIGAGHFWVARRDAALAQISPGHEFRLALIDPDFSPLQAPGATVSSELTCTNRDLPLQLAWGDPAGDLLAESASSSAPFTLLRKPTPSWRVASDAGAHWRLISHLAINYAGLTTAGLADLQAMLTLYDVARSPVSRRQIAGIQGLEHGTIRAWISTRPVAALMPGVGIRMRVDPQAFVGSALYVFAQVLDRYFAVNSQLNCFTRLQIVSSVTGEEILTCAPRAD